MKRFMLYLCSVTGMLLLILASCTDKNSQQACLYETSQNLDKGNYDAVLASPCADSLQRGAADFGKAGFSTTDVINRFIDANSGTAGSSDFKLFMSQMIGGVTDTSLGYLDAAHTEYSAVTATDSQYKNAQFSLSLVDAIKSLSLLKFVSEGVLGTLNDQCDANGNSKPDDLDASSCALFISAGQACTAVNGNGAVTVTTDVPNLNLTGKSGTYRGIVLTVSGSGTNISGCASPNEYKRLLFQSGANSYVSVATSSELCTVQGGTEQWPCPIEQNGQPLDLVTAVDQSLQSSISALQTSTTITGDVAQAITDIKTTACPSGTCTSAEIAAYLQTY